MKITLKLSHTLLTLSVLIFMSCQETQLVTTESLLKEMIDKRDVTYYPEHYYTTKQFSSYDRSSDKGDPNDYTWFANADYSFFIGQDTLENRIENIMYDAEGPGSITRFWITAAGPGVADGIIRIYIDGNEEPVIEGKAFEIIGANKVVGYPLSSALSESAPELNRGRNLYMPIPYSKHCKVTYESEFANDSLKSQLFFYNINYRTYEENTIVESFTKNTLDSLQTLIQSTNKALLSPDSFAKNNIIATNNWDISLKPTQSESTTFENDNSALSEITVKLKANDMEQALRSTVIKISFDDNQTVWCPIGDFFGTGHIWRNSSTWSTKVDQENKTLSSTWVMPFKNICKVTIENLGVQNVEINALFTQCDYKWNDNSMYFGSSWHQFSSISTGVNKERIGKGGCVDLNYINLFGKGVFVGDALSIYNPALHGHWKTWWGEGDEKIYVDGESFPSHFGTGTEDYYGYAWCRPESYSHPFIAQPIGEGNLTPGYTINSRFRALDVIPFKESFKFDMELWHWVKTTVDYAPTTFYYMIPGGTTDREIDVTAAKEKIARHRFDILTNEVDKDGLVEGESLKINDDIFSQINGYYHDNLSGGLALQWLQAKRGETLDTEFSVPKQGKYELFVSVIKEPNFPTITLSVNGEKPSSQIKCDAKEFVTEEISLGVVDLKQKDNKLSIKVIHEKTGRLAIDYIKVVSVL